MSDDSSKHMISTEGESKANTKRWSPLIVIAVVTCSYLLSQFVSGVLISLYPMLRGWDPDRSDAWLRYATNAQFFYILLSEAFTLLAIWWFLRHSKTTFRKIGLMRPRILDFGYAIAGVVVYFGLYYIVVSLVNQVVHIDVKQEQDIGFKNVIGFGALAMTFVSLAVLPPLIEEITFRGLLFSSLRLRFGFVSGTLITSILFALPHLLQGGDGKLLWIAGIDTFVLSLVLCYLREKTGRLSAGIGVHALKNAIAFLYLFIL